MVMRRPDVIELVTDYLFPAQQQERTRLATLDQWYRAKRTDVPCPRGATPELRSLLELSRTPWLGLVVTNVAQALFVDGYRSPDADDDFPPWRLWQRNGLDNRQIAIHRAALAYGAAYATALPGIDDFGASTAVLRGVSPLRMLAVYADPAEDDWPMYALRVEPQGDRWAMRLYDAEAVYYLGHEDGEVVYLEDRRHDVGVCPVVRYANMLDLDGHTDGEVEPFLPLAGRIDKTTFDRLLTQHYSSWKVRTVAGMAQPDTEEESNRARLRLRQDDILIAEDPDTKFGALPETPLDGFIRAYETDIKTLAAASQTPVHAMVGDLVNLSAEALAAARAALDAKVAERKKSFGKSHAQLLKLGSLIDGDVASARDDMAEVTWADTSVRSLATAADAYGKIAQMLGVPPAALWSMIPGVTKSDVEEWKRLADEGDSLSQLGQLLDDQAAPPPVEDPADVKAKADAMGVLIRAGVEPAEAAARVGFTGLGFTGAVPTSLRLPEQAASTLEDS